MTNSINLLVPTLDQKKIIKDYNGWCGKTYTEVKNQTYYITTYKSSNGKIISTSTTCEILPNGAVQFDNMLNSNGKNLTLITSKNRATEKNIKIQHAKALLIFDEKIKEVQVEEKQKPIIGSILFTDGYGLSKGSHGNCNIVYKILHTDYGTNYLTVERDTLTLDSKTYVKPFSELFGIGTYFEQDYVFNGSIDELNNLVIEAKEKQEEENEQKQAKQLIEAEIIANKIEEGKKIVTIPDWAKSVIVADLYSDDSDTQTDYFNTTISKTVFLAFSKNTRNNINELKKACQNWEETKKLLLEEDTIESTRKHSYLPDYFIGSSRWFGLKVNKRKFFDLSEEKNRRLLYIAAAENRYFINNESSADISSELNEASNSAIQFVDYSDKAFAIIGDTKPHKEALKALGGRFNNRLRCGAGWIFSKNKSEKEVRERFNL